MCYHFWAEMMSKKRTLYGAGRLMHIFIMLNLKVQIKDSIIWKAGIPYKNYFVVTFNKPRNCKTVLAETEFRSRNDFCNILCGNWTYTVVQFQPSI